MKKTISQRRTESELIAFFVTTICNPDKEIDTLMVATLARKIFNARRARGDTQTTLVNIRTHITQVLPCTRQESLL